MAVSLVFERRRTEVRIAGVNRWAARQQRVRKGWAPVILQRSKQRIGIDLIARAIQQPACIITTDVVTVRSDSAIDVSRRVRVKDCVSNFDCSTADAATSSSRVAAHGAVDNHQTQTAVRYSATVIASQVAADRAVNDGQTRKATTDATTSGRGEVTTDRAVDNGEVPRSFPPVLIGVNTATCVGLAGVATNCAVDDRYDTRIVVDAGSRVVVDNAVGNCEGTRAKNVVIWAA